MTSEQFELLVKTSTICEQMYERLFGNGQPGEIAKLQAEQKTQAAFRNRVRGALTVIGLLVSALGGVLITHLWRGH
jgi:hypothetical protein